jgi:hypothetical protein
MLGAVAVFGKLVIALYGMCLNFKATHVYYIYVYTQLFSSRSRLE